ncbi:oxidoreductase [Legionella fallonii]|uniref:Uncharacterized protein n=1 Tax=Legionella fallonii LLAP-10 TaxID=1212491 RepID=A0A098FZK5_9GAMM|nr:oxidoreductase [Legionella fallonii]CEG55667.1 conserved protein of unknown function [Legionella fallonii LLAP-10]
MEKGIILRVPEGMELPEKVAATLGKLLPDNEKETYQQTPDYKASIIRSINRLHAAFSFILDSYPSTFINADTLRTYAAKCKAACNLQKESVEDLHLELESFNAKLINVLSACWQWPSGAKPVKEAIALLNDADCFNMMMSHGRPDIATLTPFEIDGRKEYILQYDESIPPYYDLLLSEIETIKTKEYPKTPSWFRTLEEHQQAYLCNLQLDNVNPATVMHDLNDFLKVWNSIKDESLSLLTELKQIATNALPLPAWFNKLSVSHQEMIKVLAKKPEEIDSKLLKFKGWLAINANSPDFKRTLALIPTIPQWYWNIPTSQQYFLEHVLKNATTKEEALAFVSSRLRTLPLPSNLGVHRLIKINAQGEASELYGKRVRSSHIATRDGLKFPEAVQQRHCDSNLAKVMEGADPDKPRLMQTLISPIHLVDYVPSAVTDWLPELPPDLELYKLARAAVERSKHYAAIWQHNHPYNIAKRYYYTEAENIDSLTILAVAQKYVKDTPGLQELLDDYQNVLGSSMGSATFWDYDGRELFLSSLEHLIVLTIGGHSYASCVSGKDRRALELIHTDAMILYKLKYGCWPKFGASKDDRARFVNEFVDLYISRHQHVLAGQNAHGSEGVKTPEMYLPQDIADAIKQRLNMEKTLEYDDRLATDNEVKNISKYKALKSKLVPEGTLLCKLMVDHLGETTCRKIYDSLSGLMQQPELFKPKTSWTATLYKTPNASTGIEQIKEVMQDKQAGSSVERVEKIFSIVLERPKMDKTRPKATNSVFDRVRELFDREKSCGRSQVLADNAVREWNQLFEESKQGTSLVY